MTSQVFITVRIFFNIIKCFIKNYIYIIIIIIIIIMLLILQ